MKDYNCEEWIKNESGEDDKVYCEKMGGEWKLFSDSCVDSCDSSLGCKEVETEGCDCGVDKCWNGEKCEEENENSCEGCLIEDKCYPLGHRKDGNYCSDDLEFVIQKTESESCENNFECDSNVCVSGECIDSGFIQRVLNWFKRIFSRE